MNSKINLTNRPQSQTIFLTSKPIGACLTMIWVAIVCPIVLSEYEKRRTGSFIEDAHFVRSHFKNSSVSGPAICSPAIKLEDIEVVEPVGMGLWTGYTIGNRTDDDGPDCNFTFSVNYKVTDGTATSGIDYQPTTASDHEFTMTGTLTGASNMPRAVKINFWLYSDQFFNKTDPRGDDNADETFFIELSNPVGIRLLNNRVKVTIKEPLNKPVITNVQRTYPGFFLRGFNENNPFDVSVDWKGTPGRVRFQVNNNTPFEVNGTATGVSQAFNMGTSFPASLSPSTVKITPINAAGAIGTARTENVYVFPYPSWLNSEILTNNSALTFSAGAGEVRMNFDIKYPREPFRALVTIPLDVPFFGGQFGVKETQGTFKGHVSSTGSGSLTVSGSTGFVGMQQQVNGTISGSGDFLLNTEGLSIPRASFGLNVTGTLWREAKLLDAIPFLKRFDRFPVIKRFGESTKLRGELQPSVNVSLNWKQDPTTRDLVFDEGTGQIGLSMKGIVSTAINDRFSFKGWLAGGGSITVGAPSPFVRGLDLNFEAGAQLQIDSLFGGTELSATIDRRCTWIPSTGEANCSKSDEQSQSVKASDTFNPQINLIDYPYKRFGKYESFLGGMVHATRRELQPSLIGAFEETLISNVFAGARPTILPVGSNGKMLLWVRQNPSLPVLQSTDIAWSYYDGTSWLTPAVIMADDRAELSPVAGVDSNGNLIAVWLRLKEPAFATPISTFDDLPGFYKQLEVVTATFNSVTKTWGSITALTDDTALDTSLRLASDANGKLLLTWQSNPSGEFTAPSSAAATLKYSFWNGSNWDAVQTIAENLSNINDHAVALRGNQAFLILPFDPDTSTPNDQVLLSYSWDGISWSPSTIFAAGNVDNQIPVAVYGATGEEHVIWLHGSDLVQARLSDPAPALIRPNSNSAAFNNLRLLSNQKGNLVLVWQEITNNGPSSIFAKVYEPLSQTWGSDRLLQSDQRTSTDVSGYFGSDGQLHLAYLSTDVLRTSKKIFIDAQEVTIPNIPLAGATDLQLLDGSLVNDLAVSNSELMLTPASPEIGQSATAKLDIKNTGDFAVSNFQISLYAGESPSNGILIGSVRVSTPIIAGDHRVLSIPFANLVGGDIVAVVDSLNEVSELDKSNNRATIRLPLAPQSHTISGKVSVGTVGLSGVVMSVTTSTASGSISGTVTTSTTGAYTFGNLPAGRSYIVTPAKSNYNFLPTNKSYADIALNQSDQNFSATIVPGVPVLVSEETSTRAIALDSVTWRRDPFPLNSIQWGIDSRTRVMLFAMNIQPPAEGISVVSADAEDATHRIYPLTVEYVGKVPGLDWLNCIIVRLNDSMNDVGDVLVHITVRGNPSNRVRLSLGHRSAGPVDDLGAVPTPGRQP